MFHVWDCMNFLGLGACTHWPKKAAVFFYCLVGGLVVFCFSLTQVFRDTASFWSLRTGLILHTQLRDVCPIVRSLMWRSIFCSEKTEDFLYLRGCEQKAHILNLLAVSHRVINIHGDSYGEKCKGRQDVDSSSLLRTLLVPAERGRNTPCTFQYTLLNWILTFQYQHLKWS